MSVGLRDLLKLPEAPPTPTNVQVEELRQLFSERMAELNRSLQLIAAQAGPRDYQTLDTQRMKLYEAFQKTSTLIDKGDPGTGKESVLRMLAALESIQAKAADTASGVSAGHDEWLSREDEFDDILVRLGELEDAGDPKAATLRKLADSIRSRANCCDYQTSVSALNQLQPKFDQIYAEHRKTADAPADSKSSGKADQLGGVFPEIVGEQLKSELPETDSLIAQLEEAEFLKAPQYRKAFNKVQELVQTQAYMEAAKGHNRLRELVDADFALLTKSRLGGVRMPDEDAHAMGVDIPIGGLPGSKRSGHEPLQMEELGQRPAKDDLKGMGGYKQVEVRGSSKDPLAADYFPEGLPYSDQPAHHQDATKPTRGDYKDQPAKPAAPQGTSHGVLKKGKKGPDVAKLQKLLGLTADGDFGPKTEAAVKAFQASKGLTADGVAGPQTLAALGLGGGGSAKQQAKPQPQKREREQLQLEETGQHPPKDDLKGMAGYKQVEVRGSSKDPLAADYFPEGLPYTEGQEPHQDATRMSRADRKGSPGGSSPAKPAGGGALKQGSKGPQVAQLQKALGLKADGDFGPKTAAAVKAFQASKGLSADGVAGPQTLAALGLGGGGSAKPHTKPLPQKHQREPLQMEETGGSSQGERIHMQGFTEEDQSPGDLKRSFDESTIKMSGAVAEQQGEDGEFKFVAGSIEKTPEGTSATGVIFEGKKDGDAVTIGKVEIKDGQFTEDDGEVRMGRKASVVGIKGERDFVEKHGLPDGLVLKGDVGIGTASDESTIGEKGLSFGKQANAVEGSATIGTTGTGDRDQTIRFGASLGEGAAGRIHWDDADKDDLPEYGIGADFEWVSFDIKTEDPLGTGLQMMSSATGGIPLPPSDRNMTKDAMDVAETAGKAVGGMIRDIKDAASDLIDQAEEFGQASSDQRDRQNERDAELGQQLVQGVEDIADRLFGDS